MIRPPQRSITRFFIPLIDVLILLFCIFLLMPFVSNPEGTPDPDSSDSTTGKSVEELRQRPACLAGAQELLWCAILHHRGGAPRRDQEKHADQHGNHDDQVADDLWFLDLVFPPHVIIGGFVGGMNTFIIF